MRQSSAQTLPKTRGKISLAKMRQCRNCDKYKQQLNILRRQVFILSKRLEQSEKKNNQITILCQQIQKTKQKLLRKMVNRSQSFYNVAGFQVNHIGRNKIRSHMDQSWLPGSRLNQTVHYFH